MGSVSQDPATDVHDTDRLMQEIENLQTDKTTRAKRHELLFRKATLEHASILETDVPKMTEELKRLQKEGEEFRRNALLEKLRKEQKFENLEAQSDPVCDSESPQNTLNDVSWYRQHIQNMCSGEQMDIPLMGMIGSGKSSFIESLKCFSENKITNYLTKGEAGETNTICLESISFEGGSDELLDNIQLWDMAGLQEEKAGIGVVKLNCDNTVRHIKALLEGRVDRDFDYTQELPDDYNDTPIQSEIKKQCVVLVCRARDCSHRLQQKKSDDDFKNGWTKILKLIRGFRMSPLVVLTGCDEISEAVKGDPSIVLRSYRVQQAIHDAAKLFEVSKSSVLSVVNYTDQIIINEKLHQPLLHALYKIVESARCYKQKVQTKTPKQVAETSRQSMSNTKPTIIHFVIVLLSVGLSILLVCW